MLGYKMEILVESVVSLQLQPSQVSLVEIKIIYLFDFYVFYFIIYN